MPLMIALSAFSSMLCALSLPNELFLYGLWPLGFISLIPFYIALQHAPTPRRAALAGAIFGGLHHALTSYWLFFYKDFAFWTLGSSTIAYAVVYALLGLYGNFLLRVESPSYRPFVFAVGWAAFEYLKSTGFLGYPWGLVPYSLSAVPIFLQISDITGVYGLSFLLALSSAIGAEFMQSRKPKPGEAMPRCAAMLQKFPERGLERMGSDTAINASLFFAFSLVLVLAYGFVALSTPIPQKTTLRATLVQQNTDPWLAGELPALSSNIELARKAIDENQAVGGKPIDLLVFSETSLRRPFDDYRQWFAQNPKPDPLLPFLAENGVELLTGAPIVLNWDTYEATNSVILLSPEGRQLESYAKVHPVPFAEAIPLWEFSWFRDFMQKVVGLDSGWVMGTRLTLFPIKPQAAKGQSIQFATPICFEDAFADLCRQYFLEGADLLINLTNDSWSRKKSAQIQHWAIARIRAIENRRTLVRSTNSGVSCVVDAWGRQLYEMPQFEAAALTVDIPVYENPQRTIYTRFGEWFAKFCTLLLAFRVIFDYIGLRREKACAIPANVFY